VRLALQVQQAHLEEDVGSLHSIAEGDGLSEYADVDGHFGFLIYFVKGYRGRDGYWIQF
jgi:hypothetical protein